MRGAPAIRPSTRPGVRIIPADAGSTAPATRSDASTWDHPRGCGEHSAPTMIRAYLGGSSPRMRGALRSQLRRDRQARIIPADAGSTPNGMRPSLPHWDHPRGCGEHLTDNLKGDVEQGSSPRMRGAPWASGAQTDGVRIIPADAGSTLSRPDRMAGSRDHPRGCGEHATMEFPNLFWTGSSPRMRGALHTLIAYAHKYGIIPADAGSTRSLYHLLIVVTDHPRGCGEHT